MPYGLTATGFVRKPLEVILSEVEAKQRANTVPNLNASATSVIGGALNTAIAPQVAELWEVAEALFAAMDPDAAEDAAQENLYSLTSTPRNPATFSRVTGTANLVIGTVLIAGTHVASVSGNPQARFTPVADFTAPSTGNHAVPFVALESGPVAANAGTLTVIDVGPASGWNSITNAEDADVGEPIETNASYRVRRAIELQSLGGGTLDGIRGDLSQIDNVDGVEMLENVSNIEDENGLPPHSFESIVQGGDDDDLGESIWGNKPAGIRAFGAIPVVVEDSEGHEQTVAYSTPTIRTVYAGITVTTEGDDYAGDAAVKDAVINATKNPDEPGFLEPGDDVYAARIICAVLEVDGVIDVHVGLSFAVVPPTLTGETHLEIGDRELADFDTSRIDVFGGDDV
jgi:uncharacterized phage protein gp47/JayE